MKLISLLNNILNEGGHVFSQVNSSVPKDLLDVNIKNALVQSGLKNINYKIVGNIHKPYLGDVDIAVDIKDLSKIISFKSGDFWNALESYLSKFNSNFKINKGLKQFHLLVPLMDKHNSHTNAIDVNGKNLKEKGFIQIDLFIGNLDWLSKYLSGTSLESKYKAVYRNLLLTSIFAVVKWDNEDSTSSKYQIDKTGLSKVKFKTVDNKRVKLDIQHESDIPEEMLSKIFNKKVSFSDIQDPINLFKLYKSSNFKFPKLRSKIEDEYKKSLQKIKLNFPQELK